MPVGDGTAAKLSSADATGAARRRVQIPARGLGHGIEPVMGGAVDPWVAAAASAEGAASVAYTQPMAKRDPRDVLGVAAGASATQIKAAWRRLARTNHPDLTGDDPAASRAATRRMAEINDAYAALTRDSGRQGDDGHAAPADGATFEAGTQPRRGGPPPPKPSRPVTARVDTSGTYRARNQAVGNSARRTTLPGQPPLRGDPVCREPPRSSTPTGPLVRDRLRHFRRPPAPSLVEAEATIIAFGKFHDHTLGQIAAFEPSYIDWVAGTVSHDPDLVSAARVIQADLDRRGIARRTHLSSDRRGRSA